MNIANARRGGRRRRIGVSSRRRQGKWGFHEENGGGESVVAIEKLSDELEGGDKVTDSQRRQENQLRRLHVDESQRNREWIVFLSTI